MAQVKGIASKIKLSDDQKLEIVLGKSMASMLEKYDAATVNKALASFAKWGETLNQTGEQTGKRFNGAEGHDFKSQADAFCNVVRLGNLPKIS